MAASIINGGERGYGRASLEKRGVENDKTYLALGSGFGAVVALSSRAGVVRRFGEVV